MATPRNQTNFSGIGNQGTQIGQQFNYGGNDLHTQILQSFSSEYRKQKNLNPKRVKGTCEWFLIDERFHEWRDSTESRLLHVYAGPGCGKSVLSRCLVDEKLVANDETAAVLYFFFKDGQGEQDRSARAMTAILHQLYTQQSTGHSISQAELAYKFHGSKLCDMFEDLWDMLVNSAGNIRGNIICVLDALDECRREDRAILLSTITEFYSDPETFANIKLKVLVTSRPYPDIQLAGRKNSDRVHFIPFDGDEKSDLIAAEINLMIEAEVPRMLPKTSRPVQEAVISSLQRRKNRTYLWLYLILNYIRDNFAGRGTVSGLEGMIAQIPPTVEDAYKQMLNRTINRHLTLKLLFIVLRSFRPLTVTEAKWALALTETKYTSLNDVEVESDEQFKDTITELCGLFVTVNDARLYFIHETAREFLLPIEKRPTPEGTSCNASHPLDWQRPRIFQDLELILPFSCAICISLADFPRIFNLINHVSTEPKEYQHVVNYWDFVLYAANRWWDHYDYVAYCNGIHEPMDELYLVHMNQATTKVLNDPGRSTFVQLASYTPTFIKELLHALIQFGFVDMAKKFLRAGINPHEHRTFYTGRHAAHFAVTSGRQDMMRLLIGHGANLHAEDNFGRAPLMYAAVEGYEEIAQMIIDAGAEMEYRDRSGFTALHLAAYQDQKHLVTLLLERGADVNTADNHGNTALQHARELGNSEMVKLLIEHGAKEDSEGKTATKKRKFLESPEE